MPPAAADDRDVELDQLRRRLELLEEENERLRAKLEPIFGPDNPAFDTKRFNRAMQRINLMMLPVFLLIGFGMPLLMAARPYLPKGSIGPLPLIDIGGAGTRHPGVGVGVLALGGVAIGVIAVGGGAVGLIACGGGAVGLVAMGGGAVGLVAFGGGAVGYIAIGGSGVGWYALGQRMWGRFVFSLHRQDDEAIAFFCRWFPFLRAAVTRPMPVIPVAPRGAATSAPPGDPTSSRGER